MRREPEHFGDVEPVLAYVARKLKHALLVEQLLTEAGVDYVIETDTFANGIIFRSERIGAFFYVQADDLNTARGALERHGFRLAVASNTKT